MSGRTLFFAGCISLVVLFPPRAHSQLGQPTLPPRHREHRGICDAVDSRTTPPDNPCIVRITIQDSNGTDIGVGTGFMIGPSCMLTVRHNIYKDNGQPTGAKMVVEQTPPDDPGTTQLLHHTENHPKRFEIPNLAAHIAANEVRTGAANGTELGRGSVAEQRLQLPGDGCNFSSTATANRTSVDCRPAWPATATTDEPNKRFTLQTHERERLLNRHGRVSPRIYDRHRTRK
jgi:hypothetical protein